MEKKSVSGLTGWMATLAELAHNLFKAVPKRTAKRWKVSQLLSITEPKMGGSTGALTVKVLLEYIQIWKLLDGLILQKEEQDFPNWNL